MHLIRSGVGANERVANVIFELLFGPNQTSRRAAPEPLAALSWAGGCVTVHEAEEEELVPPVVHLLLACNYGFCRTRKAYRVCAKRWKSL